MDGSGQTGQCGPTAPGWGGRWCCHTPLGGPDSTAHTSLCNSLYAPTPLGVKVRAGHRAHAGAAVRLRHVCPPPGHIYPSTAVRLGVLRWRHPTLWHPGPGMLWAEGILSSMLGSGLESPTPWVARGWALSCHHTHRPFLASACLGHPCWPLPFALSPLAEAFLTAPFLHPWLGSLQKLHGSLARPLLPCIPR